VLAVRSFGQVEGEVAAAVAGGAPATAIRSRGMVAARALAWRRPARVPAARSRLWAMAAMASQAGNSSPWPGAAFALSRDPASPVFRTE